MKTKKVRGINCVGLFDFYTDGVSVKIRNSFGGLEEWEIDTREHHLSDWHDVVDFVVDSVPEDEEIQEIVSHSI